MSHVGDVRVAVIGLGYWGPTSPATYRSCPALSSRPYAT